MVAPGAIVVTGPIDLWRVPASDDDRTLLRSLEDISIRDVTHERFTPFPSDVPHRFLVSGKLKGHVPPVHIDTETWIAEQGLRFGLSHGQIQAALQSIESTASPKNLARMGIAASGWTVRPSGISGHVEMDLTAELTLGGTKFRSVVTYEVYDSGHVRNGLVTPPDVLRFIAAARAAPFYRVVEPQARRTDGALVVSARNGRLEMPLTWDRVLEGGNKLGTGGTLVMDMVTGRAGFETVALPLADLAACGVPELEALARRTDVAWMIAHQESGAEAHITIRPAGWILRLRTGSSWRLDLAVASKVQVLVALLPAEAQIDASARADADLRGFLVQASQVPGPEALPALRKSFPGVLLLELEAARIALDRGDQAAGRAGVETAARSAAAMRKAWEDAGVEARRGDFEQAEAHALEALRHCPSDARLWDARRRLQLAAREELPPPVPSELARWERAPYDVPSLMNRLRQLQRRVGLPITPPASVAPAPVTSSPRVELPELPGWSADSTEVESPKAPPALRRFLAMLQPSPAPDPALPALDAVAVYPPVRLPLTRALLAGTLARIAGLTIGTVPVVPRPRVSLWYNVLDPVSLLPPLDAPPAGGVPDALFEKLGPLRRVVLVRAYREPTALVSFAATPNGGVASGKVLGIDVPALAQTLVLDLAVPGGQLDAAGVRDLLTPVFEPGGQPVLGRSEVRVKNGALEVSFLPGGHEEVGLIKSLRRPTPFLSITPGRIRFDRGLLVTIDGSLRALEW